MAILKTSLSDYTHYHLEDCDLSNIAAIIKNDWRRTSPGGVNYAAKPYLDAMSVMTTVKDNYGAEDGKTIVTYALCNMSTWKGEVAKLVKAHLKTLIK